MRSHLSFELESVSRDGRMLRWVALAICWILGNAAHANQHLMWLNLRNRDILQVHDRLVTIDTGDKSFASVRSHFGI
jgi:hypothetical protein